MTDVQRLVVLGDRLGDLDNPSQPGSGWVRRLGQLAAVLAPERRLAVFDHTDAGQTIRKLRERYADEVVGFAPDLVLLHAGTSDAWGMVEGNAAQDEAAFAASLADLIACHRATLPQARLVLVEPCINTIDSSPQRLGPVVGRVRAYRAVVAEVARAHGLALLPAGSVLHAAKEARDDEWCGHDPLALTQEGQVLLARAALPFLGLADAAPATAIGDGQTLLCIGDSITDAGRRGEPSRLGVGWVRALHGLVAARCPDRRIRIVNKGIGGDTVVDLAHRWHRDCLAHRPDWVTVKIGINDLNQQYNPRKTPIGPEVYERHLDECLARLRQTVPAVQVAVIAPFHLSRCADPALYPGEVQARLPGYIAAARAVADRHRARFLDTQALFRRHLAYRTHRELGPDLVHLTELGAMILGDAVYQTLA
jgi:lysophospholipase L1-like esterase